PDRLGAAGPHHRRAGAANGAAVPPAPPGPALRRRTRRRGGGPPPVGGGGGGGALRREAGGAARVLRVHGHAERGVDPRRAGLRLRAVVVAAEPPPTPPDPPPPGRPVASVPRAAGGHPGGADRLAPRGDGADRRRDVRPVDRFGAPAGDRKSTRLNSSHGKSSHAVS